MNYPSEEYSSPDANETALIRASEDLQQVLKELRQAQKLLRRDWEFLAPRERSAQSRIVKELEQRKKILEEEIEMNSGV